MNTQATADTWTVDQTGKFLNRSRWSVYRDAAAGKIPAYRVGSSIRFLPDEIREWLKAQRVTAK